MPANRTSVSIDMLEPQRILRPHAGSKSHQQDVAEDGHDQRNDKGLHRELSLHGFIRAWFGLVLEEVAPRLQPNKLADFDYCLHKPMQPEDENKRNGKEEEWPWEHFAPKYRDRAGKNHRQQKREKDRCEKTHALFLRSNVGRKRTRVGRRSLP